MKKKMKEKKKKKKKKKVKEENITNISNVNNTNDNIKVKEDNNFDKYKEPKEMDEDNDNIELYKHLLYPSDFDFKKEGPDNNNSNNKEEEEIKKEITENDIKTNNDDYDIEIEF